MAGWRLRKHIIANGGRAALEGGEGVGDSLFEGWSKRLAGRFELLLGKRVEREGEGTTGFIWALGVQHLRGRGEAGLEV